MPTATTCPDLDVLRHYSLGAVRETEAAAVEAHLASCPHCIETLHGIDDQDSLVDAMREQSALAPRPEIDATVTRLMTAFKGWTPSVSHHGVAMTGKSSGDEVVEFLAAAQQPDELGRLGPYRILKVLGTGGMGIVFEAEDTHLRRRVALKALRPLLAANSMARRRFLREARAAAKVVHDHIVTIYQADEADGIPFLAMPYLAGETLEARLRREGPLPLADIICIGRELAEGLSAAHSQGLLHRDIKPANVWLESRSEEKNPMLAPRVKILDFGLAWAADDEGPLTEHGTVIGTPAYMAPEQARGETVDVRSDLFSLGSVLYAMCAGQAPFHAPSNFATLEKVRTETPPDISSLNPGIPSWLIEIVTKLHAKNPAERFQSAAEVAAALASQKSATSKRRASGAWRGWLTAAASVLLLAIVGLTLAEATGVTELRRVIVGAPEPHVGNDAPKPPTDVPAPPVNGVEPAEPKKQATVYPAALFAFEERGVGVKDFGAKVSDILFARLAARPEVVLIDRADLKKTLAELELNISGVVNASDATKIGQLTGAKIMISGSVFQVDKKTYLVARIVGVETSKTVAASVNGKSTDELAPLVEKLAEQVGDAIVHKGETLVAKAIPKADRIAAVSLKLKGVKLPVVSVKIHERHVGGGKIDPAAQTELSRFCKETGFALIDPDEGVQGKCDVLIVGEAFSETATRVGNLVSVKARVEIKMIDRKSGEILAADRQTAMAVDLTEMIAGKTAIEEAAAILAERMLPKLSTAHRAP